jgi:hypothetical protein
MRYLRLRSKASDMVIVLGPVSDEGTERLRAGTEAPMDALLTAVLEQDGALRMEHYSTEIVEL